MDKQRIFKDLSQYIEALHNAKILKVVCAEINEKRSVQVDENSLEVLPVLKADFIAYRDSVILKYESGELYNDDVAALESAGFEVVRRDRNIT
ncbi:MAG: hypothetical protein PF450_17090 [Bacteroidales bacterium]|jgi:hypothetical protein|nr:hypothetical protein [Bacteroidales bacterium]